MAISAYLESASKPAERHRSARRKLRLLAHGHDAAGVDLKVLIHNISATGLLIESKASLSIDEEISIGLPHSGASWARVIWTSGDLYGCQFAAPISSATLNAAQLRGVVIPDINEISGEPVAPGESFGARLQRLRTAKGLTQAQIADHLHVSEPSISAWEADKSRPKAGRIEALSTLLGVRVVELMGHEKPEDLDGLVAQAKQDIARAVGTAPEKIRISIEF